MADKLVSRREHLIREKVCIACQREPACKGVPWGTQCLRVIAQADMKAYTGALRDVRAAAGTSGHVRASE